MYSKMFAASTTATSRSSVASSAEAEENGGKDSGSAAKIASAENAADLTYQPAMTAAGR
jgi:hypothetical protein